MKKEIQLSVLMSVYYKEAASNLRECLESLTKQTILASEWVIVKDGPLTDELEAVLKEYEERFPNLIKYVVNETNQGLGRALAAGLPECSYPLIARMDTDDICVPERFEKQLKLFENNPQLDICGSYIYEFEGTMENVVSRRLVPIEHDDIRKYQKRRSAFNHMTVMYKKDKVIESGNYQHALLMEDDLLWVNMLLHGARCANIPEYLVYARVGKDMINRRGGYSYFKKYKSGRKVIYDTGFISKWDYTYTLLVQFVVALVPTSVRTLIFKKLLRN